MFNVAAAIFFHKELNATLGHLSWKLYFQIAVLFLPSNIEEPVLFSAYYFPVPIYHPFFNKASVSTSESIYFLKFILAVKSLTPNL